MVTGYRTAKKKEQNRQQGAACKGSSSRTFQVEVGSYLMLPSGQDKEIKG